jgi:hypothetical protein
VDAEVVRQSFAAFGEVHERLEFPERQELARLLIREATCDGQAGKIRRELRQVPGLQPLLEGDWRPSVNSDTNLLHQSTKLLDRLHSNHGGSRQGARGVYRTELSARGLARPE